MRRLPVYFLLDTSGSMYGEPIEALNNALRGMLSVLRTDPQTLETLWLSIITFNREVTELVPLTELADFQLPEIVCPQSGPTHTGHALEMLYNKVKADFRTGSATQKGDWRPLLFLITDGKPSDVSLYRSMIPQIKSLNFAAIVGCAAGYLSNDAMLLELTDTVVHLETADSSTLKQFFRWVSDTIEHGNKSTGTSGNVNLPPPPGEIHLVI
ncbi:VWA domain-containing protein [Mucilaginibacter sp. CSA2-8R]|uniref:vWA domain-containing protein n=1 Tax=Mucilaginibacter sp. CSA2-8R TaxID=3141542 RepID=UPI00315C8A1E